MKNEFSYGNRYNHVNLMTAWIAKQSIFAVFTNEKMGGEMHAYLTRRNRSRDKTSPGGVGQSKDETKFGEIALIMIIGTKTETTGARTVMVPNAV